MNTNVNTLWVFGDSYAEMGAPIKGQHLEGSHLRWSELLAEKLGCVLENFGLGGTAIEYSSTQFSENYQRMKSNDIVVLCLTDIERKWIIENSPSTSSIRMLDRLHEHDKLTDTEYELYCHYFSSIVNYSIERQHAFNFLNALNFCTLKKGMKLIIIPCFFNSDGAESKNVDLHDKDNLFFGKHVIIPKKDQCLWHISINEFKGREKKLPLKVIDHRLNHLSMKNHEILSDLLVDAILNDSVLDIHPSRFAGDLFTAKEVRVLGNTWQKTMTAKKN